MNTFCVGAFYPDFTVIGQAAMEETVNSEMAYINTLLCLNKTISENTCSNCT